MTAYTNASKAATGLALSKFRQILTREGTFSTAQIGAVLEHVRREGCVTEHTPYVRPAEVEPLTALLIGCYEEVDLESGEWDEDEGLWVPNDLHDASEITDEEREAFARWVEEEDQDWPDDRTPDRNFDRSDPATTIFRDPEDDDTGEFPTRPDLPPITGGAIDDLTPEYIPTEQDWAEYNAWCETVDAIDDCNNNRDSEMPV